MGIADRIMSRMERVVGDATLSGRQMRKYLGPDVKADLVLLPEAEDQISDIVRLDCGGEVLLLPAGSKHQILSTRIAGDQRPIVVLASDRLKQFIGYSHEDLTLTVHSGVTLAELDELASKFDQHLPVDPPHSRTATIGGAVASNATGPRCMLHGNIGTYILGGAMVLPDGAVVKSGARTVKSVAGYDLHKLFVGSYGSLGVITQVALKLKPIPEDFRLAELLADHISEAMYIVGQLIRGKTRPALVTLFNALGARDLEHEIAEGQVLLRVGYEDSTEAVEWQMTQLHVTYGEKAILLNTEASLEEYSQMVEWPTGPSDYSFEALILGGQTQNLVEFCSQRDIATMAHARNGTVQGRGYGDLTPEIAQQLREAAGAGSTIKFIKLPKASRVSRWGSMDPARQWMRAVKEHFDPNHLFPWPGFLGT